MGPSPHPLRQGTPGTYMLLVEVARASRVKAGRTRSVDLEPGLYCYAGSALGPGGLAARLRRHASRPARKHWHVDHLLERAKLVAVLVIEDDVRHECAWATWVEGEALSTIDGFGASDCRCSGHLFHLGKDLDSAVRDRFATRAWQDLGARPVQTGRLAERKTTP